jgi:hypothetical protein
VPTHDFKILGLVVLSKLETPHSRENLCPSYAKTPSPSSAMQSLVSAPRQAWMPSSVNDCCQMCRSFLNLVARQRTGNEAIMDFHNIRQLKESSENGCHMCTLILLCISDEKQRQYLGELERTGEGEPQFVAVVWFFAFPPPNPRTTPFLRLEEANPRPPVCNRVVICELKCEVPTDVHQLSMYD